MDTTLVQSDYEIERRKPTPSRNHAYIQSQMIKLLDRKYSDRYEIISELSLLLEDAVLVPDILIYKDFAFRPGNDEVKVKELPVAVIEILSPTQHLADLVSKCYQYFDAGIPSYWLVLPDLTTIYVFSAPHEYEVFAKKGTLKDTVLGLEVELEAVFGAI